MYRHCPALIFFFFLFLFSSVPAQTSTETEEKQETKEEEKPNPYFERLAPPDRAALRRFEQAKRLIEAQRLAEAAQLLGAILEGPIDFFLVPPFEESEDKATKNATRTTERLFGDLVLETLLGFPAKARESYTLQYETQARRLLENAVREGSIEGVQFVARRYFPTSAGADAAFLLGTDQLERGAYESAAMTLERLNRSKADLVRYEPTLSLSLALCRLRLGRNDLAREAIDRLLQRDRSPEILLFGKEPWKPKTTDEILERLEKQLEAPVSVAAWLERAGWQLPSGTASQNAETEAEKPLLELLWSVPTLNKTVVQQEARSLLGSARREKLVHLPAARPLVVGDRILSRGFSELVAVDARTGKLLWTASEPEYRLAKTLHSPLHHNLPMWRGGMGMDAAVSLRLHFWHDRISHQMSSDGFRLFSIDGHDLKAINFAGLGQGVRKIQIGRKSVEDLRGGPGNTLSARDVVTGQILWQVGKFPYVQKYFDRVLEDYEEEEKQRKANKDAGSKDGKKDERKPDRDFSEEERFLGETWFLGAPLPLEGRLHVIGENAGLLRLIVLDAETGRLIRQVPIATPAAPFENDAIRKFLGLIPSASGGVLLCPTALGMVVALDATTAVPLWCFSYLEPPKEGEGTRNRGNRNLPFQLGGGQSYLDGTGWQMPSIMIDADRVLVAPPDDANLYCLELATGKLLWKNERNLQGRALYVACIRNDTAFFVTPNGMAALDMKTGESVWAFPTTANQNETEKSIDETGKPKLAFPNSLKPVGVGVHNGGLYFLPFSDGRLGIVDLDQARLEWMSAGLHRVQAPQSEPDASETTIEEEDDAISFEERSLRWTQPETSLTRPEIMLGNLVGIQGRFFSQSPTLISCFDQFAPLERRAGTLLEADPESPEGLMLLGRIRFSERKWGEAVDLFRRAAKVHGGDCNNEYASDFLRRTLLEAFRNDYGAWKSRTEELESLAEFPEESGEILYVLARGALDDGDGDAFLDALQKAFALEIDHSIQVPVDAEYRTQLHRALGVLVEEFSQKTPDASRQAALDQTAETIFNGLAEKKASDDFLPKLRQNNSDLAKHRFLMRPWWEEDATALSSEARRWQVFTELFGSLSIADRAGAILDDYYQRNRLFASLELKINPPVDWRLPAALTEALFGKTTAAEEPMTLKPMPVSPTSPPYFPSKPTAMEDLERLAKSLLSQDNPAGALYYCRMAENSRENSGGEFRTEFWQDVLDDPEVRKHLDREQAAATWPNGKVAVEDEERPKPDALTQNARNASIASILRGVHGHGNSPGNRRSIPFFGSFEPFLSPYAYCLETSSPSAVHLLCSDEWGVERWRCPVSEISSNMSEYGYFSENFSQSGPSEQTVYVKGCHHLLVFVRDHELIAFDTFRLAPNEGPKVLWTKTLSGKLPCRQMHGVLPMSHLQGSTSFPKESLFVSPQVVCYLDAEQVVGLDPLSGQTLWSRSIPSSYCSILGDRDHLFLVFPDIHQAIAVDPASGRQLASGTIPGGGFFTFGTNIVFVRQLGIAESGVTQRPYQLHVGDLRELFQKRRRALLVSSESVSGSLPSLPMYPIREELTHEAMARQFHHGRFLASVSWTSKTLQIYDLETKRDLLGPVGDFGRRTGVKLPEMNLRETRRRHDCDFDVELVDDKFLVYFIEKGEINSQWKGELNENGEPVRRRRHAVNNLAARNCGRASLMLYDVAGNECWTNPVRIEDWYRMLRVPEGLPVTLFVVSMTEQKNRAVQHKLFTGIWGIDKRTGQKRFRSWIAPLPPNLSQTMLQGFRVQADPWKKEIAFITPHRTVLAKFTDEKNETKKSSDAKPAEKPWPNIFDRMFDLFGE